MTANPAYTIGFMTRRIGEIWIPGKESRAPCPTVEI